MRVIHRGWSAGVAQRPAVVRPWPLVFLLLAVVLATGGCGGSPAENPLVKAGITPDQKMKSSRDYSRAEQLKKAKGRPIVRR